MINNTEQKRIAVALESMAKITPAKENKPNNKG